MEFSFVKHSNCSSEELINISKLKSQFWKYSVEEQLSWIDSNVKDSDVHLFLKEKGYLVGYLTITELNVKVGDKNELLLGIGSVCVDEMFKGKKIGKLLLKLVDYYFDKNNISGILLCKDELVPFYEKCNWKLFSGEVYFKGELFRDNLMFNDSRLQLVSSDSKIIELSCFF